jgi:predicted nucleotidyltransferase
VKSHQEILPELIRELTQIDKEMGIILIGSVARGCERSDSDIDLTVLFPGNSCPDFGASPFFSRDNRWALKSKGEIQEKRIDLAWETEQSLLIRLNGPEPDKDALMASPNDDELFDKLEKIRAAGDGPAGCWPLATGKIIYDPLGVAERCQTIAIDWFNKNEEISDAIERGYLRYKAIQRGT